MIASTVTSGALAAYCSNCDTYGTGNYCSSCGRRLSSDSYATDTFDGMIELEGWYAIGYKFEYPSKADEEAGRKFHVSGIYYDPYTHSVVVKWVDKGNCGPYTVEYRYNNDKYDKYTHAYTPTHTTKSKSVTLDRIIPGEHYEVFVYDANDVELQFGFQVPISEFVDGKLHYSGIKISLQYMYLYNGQMNVINENDLEDSKMEGNRRAYGYNYGVRYHMNFPQLIYSRTYDMIVVVYYPDGTICRYDANSQTFFSDEKCDYDIDLFDYIYGNNNGDIPTGRYAIKLFFDGMLVNTKTFNVR